MASAEDVVSDPARIARTELAIMVGRGDVVKLGSTAWIWLRKEMNRSSFVLCRRTKTNLMIE